MGELKKGHVVQYNSTRKSARNQTGVVKWVGKNGDGTALVLVRWDSMGSHILHPQDHLRIATIALNAYDRIGYERRGDTSSEGGGDHG